MKASEDHEVVRRQLQEKIQQAHRLFQAFPLKLKSNLIQTYPSMEDDFKGNQKSLKNGECWILVAGEIGAGKSSLINLILDCQLLPTDAQKCTNTIIEIRCSDEKLAKCFYKPELSDSGDRTRKIPPREIRLNDLKGIQEFKDSVVECDENDDNPFQRVELYHPFKKLSKQVVIVDTPGIDGGNNVGRRLELYLNKSFGFLYVISTNAAGGLQQGRARDFYLNRQGQLKDHELLLQKIGQLISSSLRQGLINHYWWLSGFLTRSNYVLRVTSVQHEMTEDETRQRYKEMKNHVEELQIALQICTRRVYNWEDPRGCPQVDRKWKRTVDAAAMLISERIAMVIDGWQREHSVLSKIDKEIIDVFSKEFGLLQHQVDDIEKFLADNKGKAMMMKTVKRMTPKGIFGIKKGKVERTYNTMGGAVSCIGMLDTGNKNIRKLFKDRYTDKATQNQRAAVMAEATT
ncbi:YOR6-like protein, partial [Mya arenaria]